MTRPRVIVLGGTGFLGRRTIPMLVAGGFDPVCVVRSHESAQVAEAMGASYVYGDLDDVDSLRRAFLESNGSTLVCIASLGFGHAPSIVRATQDARIQRALFVSTTAIFTKLNASSRSIRVAAENRIENSALDYTVLRPTMIYGGPDDRNVSRLVRATSRLRVFPMPGSGKGLQQPVHVEDVASAIVSCVDNRVTIRNMYNIAGPTPLTFHEMVASISQLLNRKVVLVPVPLRPIIAAARLAESVMDRPWLRAEQFERLAEDKTFDNHPAIEDFHFSSRTFSAGIKQLIVALGLDSAGEN